MIIKVKVSEIVGCSYWDQTLRFTWNQLNNAFGEPKMNPGFSDVSSEWFLKIDNIPFTIYDWHSNPIFPTQNRDVFYEWHIGSRDKLTIETLIKIREFVESKNY